MPKSFPPIQNVHSFHGELHSPTNKEIHVIQTKIYVYLKRNMNIISWSYLIWFRMTTLQQNCYRGYRTTVRNKVQHWEKNISCRLSWIVERSVVPHFSKTLPLQNESKTILFVFFAFKESSATDLQPNTESSQDIYEQYSFYS